MSKDAKKLVETWRGLHASERLVADALAYKAFPALTVTMSLTDLESKTSRNRATVQRALNAFEAAGWIDRKRQQQPRAGHITTTIEFLEGSRFQELTDAHRPHKSKGDPRCMVHLGRGATHLGLGAPRTQLNKEGESLGKSFKTDDGKDTSSISPTPPSREGLPDASEVAKLAYAEELRNAFNQLPHSTPSKKHQFSHSELQLCFAWFDRQIPSNVVEIAMWTGIGRNLHKPGDQPPDIRSMNYFAPIVEEILPRVDSLQRGGLPRQLEHLRKKVITFIRITGS